MFSWVVGDHSVRGFTGRSESPFLPAATSAAVASAPPAYTGLAGGVINAARQTGSVIGVAVLGAMITGGAFLTGFHLAVGTAAAVFLAAAVPAARLSTAAA